MADAPVAGTCDPGWSVVGEAFAANFGAVDDDPGDLGAALCVIVDGRIVVDLWGGWTDRTRTNLWAPDTLVNTYSVGKGVSAAVALVAVSRGLIDLDEPLQRWWPELGASTTFRQVLSHRAGLPALREDAAEHLPLVWHEMCNALAATEPWWEPGSAHGYHTNTFGYLVGEPVRRAVGAQRFGDVLSTWFAEPHGADFFFGVPRGDMARCAVIDMGQSGGAQAPDLSTAVFASETEEMIHRSYYNPPALSGLGITHTDEWRRAEVPSTNGHASARGVARIFAAVLDPSGPVDPAVLAEATRTQSEGVDLVLGKRSRFGLGFQLHEDHRPVGVTDRSFGHFGFGGSLGFADPTAGLAVGYVINRPGDRWQIPRTKRLVGALREVVGDVA